MSTILLVEDSQTQALRYKLLLEDAGYEVRHVADGHAALEACSRWKPDLVIIDRHLGKLSGLDVCRRIKEDPTRRLVPVLILTSGNPQKEEVAALEAGADRFLMKDSGAEELLAVVGHLLLSPKAEEEAGETSELLMKVLLVDDDRTFLFKLENELAETGFKVTCAKSGPEALRQMDGGELDVCVIDLVMPEMDGYEVCREARARANSQQKPLGLLILTAREDKDSLLKSLEAGADDFVGKTFDTEVVIGRIRALARRIGMLRQTNSLRQMMLLKDAALREAELRSKHSKELERANLALAEAYKDLEGFSYSVSHDLRAPLRAINGFATMLSKDHADKLNAEGKRLLGVVVDSTRKMSQLIEDLLKFARLGRTAMTSASIDMTTLAREVLAETLQNVGTRKIQATVESLPSTSGDLSLLRQVFVNLIGNAVKYTHKIESARVEVQGWNEEKETVYRVRDNGMGFDMEYAHKLFRVFQRLHTDRQVEGTGVGLALVRKIVERHGGRVWAEGKEGEGAAFYFSLPRTDTGLDAGPNSARPSTPPYDG